MHIYAASYLYPVSGQPVPGGAIAVENGRIVALGTRDDLCAAWGGTVTDFPGRVIMPGLVNAHTHLELTHFPAWKLRKGIDYSPRTYVDWIIQVIKIRRALTRDELAHSVREGIRKSLESGTTSAGEILTDRNLLPHYHDAPLGGRLYAEAIGHDPARCEQLLSEMAGHGAAVRREGLFPGISPHAPHTLSSRFLADLAAAARHGGMPLMIHLAESKDEVDFFHDTSGKIAELLYPFTGWEAYLPPPRHTTPVAYLDSLGLFGRDTAVVHCVHVTPADAEILGRRGVTAILCPRSNDRLAVGQAPVRLLKKAGIPLALGTDSLASNDSLSLWDELRFLRRQFPGEFTPVELIELVTIGAARALALDHEVGSLEQGKRADFLVIGIEGPASLPDIPDAVVEQGEVMDVFVGGRPIGQEAP